MMGRINVIALLLSTAKKLNIKLARVRGFDFDLPQPFVLEDLQTISPKVHLTLIYM